MAENESLEDHHPIVVLEPVPDQVCQYSELTLGVVGQLQQVCKSDVNMGE